MHIQIIDNINDGSLPAIRTLYEESFPLYERREWEQLMELLQEPAMKLGAITEQPAQADNDNTHKAYQPEMDLVGFIIWWELAGWCYIEHFAILPSLRGKQFGGGVIQYMQRLCPKLVLETSPPKGPDNERRVRFYERHGLTVAPFAYVQPPYRKGEAPVPMIIMSKPDMVDINDFGRLTRLIRDEVYERYYR